jgi:N-acetylglutamate synthase-like GNAT family acetyltransferase
MKQELPIAIRPAEPHDASQISRLLDQLGYGDDPEAIAKRLDALIAQPANMILVAENESRNLLGCIHVLTANRLAEGAYGEIASLVIAETHRSHGIGRQLVEHAVRWLQKKGMIKMRVRCNVIRKGAHRFYDRLGFGETKSQKVFDRKLA